MEENYRHQFSAHDSLISATQTLLQTSKYWLSGPGHGSNFVQGRSCIRNRVGSTTAAWISSFGLDLWRKIIVINFRLIIRWFRSLVHYYRPPNTGFRSLGVAEILCRCVNIEEMEMDVLLQCRRVVYELNCGGKLLPPISGSFFIDSEVYCTRAGVLRPAVWSCM